MNMQPNAKGQTIRDYLPMAAQKLIGKAQPEKVTEQSSVTPNEQAGPIDKKAIEKAAETLRNYKDGKRKHSENMSFGASLDYFVLLTRD